MATTSAKPAEATADPEAKSPTASSDLAATETEEATPLPDVITVKNIWAREIPLASGVLKPGDTGEASKAEYENFAGTYLVKAE